MHARACYIAARASGTKQWSLSEPRQTTSQCFSCDTSLVVRILTCHPRAAASSSSLEPICDSTGGSPLRSANTGEASALDAYAAPRYTRENSVMLFFFFQAEDGIRDLIVTGV